MGELAADTYTTDPDLADCFDCESLMSRPRDAAAVATAYAQGYADGRDKSFLELEEWRPRGSCTGVAGAGCARWPGASLTRSWASRPGNRFVQGPLRELAAPATGEVLSLVPRGAGCGGLCEPLFRI